MTGDALHRRRQLLSTTSGVLVGGVAYLLTLLNYSTDLGRTATGSGFFSGVYELQARALLDGRLSLPEGSMGVEAFIHDDRTQMYFPPFPALLRLPVLMTTHEFDGRLTLLSMALAWTVFAVMTVKLVWLLVALLTDDGPSRLTSALVALFIAAATGGTFLTYDASLPWVYHEVYTWSASAVVGGCYWLTRVVVRPDWHALRWLAVFALVAAWTRATAGMALCLVTIVLGIVWLVRRRHQPSPARPPWWGLVLAGGVPLAASVVLNLVKFDHPFMFPLDEQVWTQVNEQRRIALAANGGSLTGLQFFPTSFMAYLRPDGIRFVDAFPWVSLPASPARSYAGAVVDQSYRTGSITAFMPLLLVLGLVAAVAVLRPRAPRELALLRAPLAASVLVTGGVMAYGYYAARYASEFVPALVVCGAIGTVVLCRFLEHRPRWTPVAIGVVAVGTLFSIGAQLAIGLTTAAYQQRGPDLVRYLTWQHSLSAGSQASRVEQVDGLPEGGGTDDLAVRGECDALFLNTGDAYEPWITVQERDHVLVVSAQDEVAEGSAVLAEVSGSPERTVELEADGKGRLRLVVADDLGRAAGPWFDIPRYSPVRIGMRNLTEFGSFELSSSPGGLAGYVPSAYFDEDWNGVLAEVRVDPDQEALRRLGVSVDEGEGLPLTLCESIETAAALDDPPRP